jgi:hypothetical protein
VTELLQLRREHIKQWAGLAYERVCEVLDRVGLRNSPDSIRAIFNDVIAMGISARVATTKAELEHWARENGYSGPLDAQLFGFDHDVGRVKSHWYRALESEALQCELAAKGPRRSKRQLPTKADAPTHSKILSNAEAVSRKRAALVARLIKELNALRSHLQVPEEDFPRLAAQHPQYRVFTICKKHAGASKWVELLCVRRRVESLAWQLAAVECGVSTETIKTAWKRYKPRRRTSA